MTLDHLVFSSARDLARRIAARELSARDVMAAHLNQIARVNPTINAIISKLDDARCLDLADRADRQLAAGHVVGPLHGLPIAFKDLEPVDGFAFTRGSRIFKDDIAREDSAIVERLKRAGALPIGKTNVPEFGMGSHTYNAVFGVTRNPYDPAKSAGGSSGGAGAALAAGLLPIADGSDLGGSLRNPANFNNIVALRPTFGLVPAAPAAMPFAGFGVKGPMARSVEDVAFMLATIAGEDSRDPASYPSDPKRFLASLGRSFDGARIAWATDLGGLPIDPRVRAVVDAQRAAFEALGCRIDDACPDLRDADEIFLTIRRWMSAQKYGPLLDGHRDEMKQEAVEEIELGRRVTAAQLADATAKHMALLDRVRVFQETYEFLVCVVNQVPPFDASLDWPKSIDGTPMESYVSWMKSAYWISTTLRPALSVPAGFTADGLPVGIQIVGRYRDDFGVLQLGHAFEQKTRAGLRRPTVAI